MMCVLYQLYNIAQIIIAISGSSEKPLGCGKSPRLRTRCRGVVRLPQARGWTLANLPEVCVRARDPT